MVSTCVGPKTERPELKGTLRQRTKNGRFSYRLIVLNGTRKEFALQTRNYDEAVQKASELDSIWLGFVNKQVTRNEPQALPQLREIRDIPALSPEPELEPEKKLELELKPDVSFEEAWEIYKMHPNRAIPYTVEERIGYRRAFREFTDFASGTTETSVKYPAMTIRAVTPKLCEEFSAYLKTTNISVHTHNRKIKRLRLIFDCFKDYYEGNNPFRSKTLMRNEREELGNLVHRRAFTKEQEEQLLAVLSDSKRKHKLKNKTEIRIVYTIGMFTGQCLKDCVLLQWQNVDMKNRRIWVKQFKTGKEVSIPIAPVLYKALREAEKWKSDQYVTPKCAARYKQTNAEGKNTSNNLIDIDVLRPIRWIGLEPSVTVPGRKRKMTVYGFHSLRHSFASFCAEAGVPPAVLLSLLGTDSRIADRYYTHVSEESQWKAIAAISNRNAPTSQEKIDRVLNLLMPEGKEPNQTDNSTLQQVLKILKEA